MVAASTAGRLAARILGEKFEYVISAEPRGRFKGWVEEVDSCTELRFRSSEELLKFLGQRFDLVLALADQARLGNSRKQGFLRKKSSRKERSAP